MSTAMLRITSILVLLLGVASSHEAAKCLDLVIPVHISAPSYPPIFPPISSGSEATEFLLQATKRDANEDTTVLLGPPVNISTTFSIAATYCTPVGKKSDVVQLLSHGLGFDRTYWNLDGDNNYKNAAAASGYATFFYDRIGTGLSSKPDPYTMIQVPIELAILVELTKLLRSGKISPKIPKALKVVHVGHSYGSQLTNALVASLPELSDGAIMSGYSHNTTWQRWFQIATGWHLARDNQPARFANYSTGYMTWGDKFYNQYAFLKYPFFDDETLTKAEANKMPYTLGELLTFPLAPVLAPNFAKPALVCTTLHFSSKS
jgi:pimeloyl-ACP methyl ester carboxylesterase